MTRKKPQTRRVAHLKWIICLGGVPASYYALGFLGKSLDAYLATLGFGFLASLLLFLSNVVPIVFLFLLVKYAYRAWRTSALSLERQRIAAERAHERRAGQIGVQGGPDLTKAAMLRARTTAHHLRQQLVDGNFPALHPSAYLALKPGEGILAQTRIQYSRYYGMTVNYTKRSTLIFGNPLLMLGGVVGSSIGNSRARASAQAMAATQWREHQFTDLVVTDRRLLAHVGGRWLEFWFDCITAMYPYANEGVLVLDFGNDCVPLRIATPEAAALSIWITHQLKGPEALQLWNPGEVLQR